MLTHETDRLAYELARNKVGADLPVRTVLTQLGVPESSFAGLLADKQFTQLVRKYCKELQEDGVSFKLKARVIAEDALAQLYKIIHDDNEPGSTRLKALDKAVEYAEIGPKPQNTATGMGVPTVIFNFPANTPVSPNLSPTAVQIEHVAVPTPAPAVEHDS